MVINSCDNAWIINSFISNIEVRSDQTTEQLYQSDMYIFVPSTELIRSDRICTPLVDTPVNRVPPPLLWAAIVWAPLKRENIEIRLSISFVVKTVYLFFLGVTKTETLRTLLTPTILISIFKTQKPRLHSATQIIYVFALKNMNKSLQSVEAIQISFSIPLAVHLFSWQPDISHFSSIWHDINANDYFVLFADGVSHNSIVHHIEDFRTNTNTYLNYCYKISILE